VPKTAKVVQESKRAENSHGASKSKPQTMEELLNATGYQFKGLKRGETVTGVITGISGKAVLVDIGAKTEGLVGEREFDAARDFIKTLKVGDRLSFQVVNPESESSQIYLSLRKSAMSSGWGKLLEAKEKGEELEVLVSQAGKSGLVVESFGLTGFIPNSQIGSQNLKRLNELVEKRIKVKLVEVDEANERLIFSEKAVSEKEKIAEIAKAIEKVKIGHEYEGTISGVTPFGVFVQIKIAQVPIEGLVHISEIAWEKVDDPGVLLKVGDEVQVKVISTDKKAGRLALSLKQLISDPWLELAAKYPPETRIKGKVVRLSAFGAFVEIEPNLTGLLHISKIPAQAKINVGDELSCFVEAVEPEKRRLSLGLVLKEKPVGYK